MQHKDEVCTSSYGKIRIISLELPCNWSIIDYIAESSHHLQAQAATHEAAPEKARSKDRGKQQRGMTRNVATGS